MSWCICEPLKYAAKQTTTGARHFLLFARLNQVVVCIYNWCPHNGFNSDWGLTLFNLNPIDGK